ncbi:MAG: elongation factor G [Phycisphaerales bacterium]|nr:elongation factor G [Phycisphaerales bacterium]
MPASKAENIRNIVLLGHGSSGKTTLGEAMLFAAKVTSRLGSVDDGTSHLDYSDIEKDRKHTIDPSMAFLDHAGTTINIIDTPGYPDFIGGAISASGGADIAVIVISAHAGIEVNTRRMFKLAQANNMPVAIIINKIDDENADLESILTHINETFGSACKPMNLPTGENTAIIGCFANKEGSSDLGDVADARTELIDNIVEADEELMEAYLGDEELTAAQLSNAMSKAMIAGTVIPILFTAAKSDVGITEAMDAIAKYFPSPVNCPTRPIMKGEGEDAEELEVSTDPEKPLIAQAFKITTDPFVGKLAWVRILQGTVTPDTHFYLADAKKHAKVGHLYKVLGKESKDTKSAVAGDIIALAKIEDITPGGVLHGDHLDMYGSIPACPTPMFSLAVTPKKRGDEQKISEALSKLSQEDPTFVYAHDTQTHETVISGIGDLHLRILLTKMKGRFDVEVETKPPKIPYKETITGKAEGHHRHKKQTGGSGQFGEVYLRVEPMERGEGFEFVNALFGESIPRQYLPAIEKGVKDVLTNGAVAGYPMQDIRVSVYDGKHHPVDSKEVAFRAAGKWAFINAVKNAKPAILEPVVDMEIAVPADFMGDIASDLSGRRGRIIGQDMLPGNQVVVKAQAPLSEVMQYNSQLRSVTGGQGSYTMELSHYEPVPGNVQQQLVAALAKEKEEEH